MAKQGFKNIDSNTFIYQEQTASAAIGLDSTDSNKLKIDASSTTGASPTGAASFVIDGSANGNITASPKGSGNIVLNNVYTTTVGNTSGVMLIDNGSIVGSTADTADGTVLIGNTGSPPSFSATPSVSMITIADAPVNPTDGTNKQYVDSIASGFTFIAAVRVGTTGSNLTATYANGAAGVGATLTNAGTQVALTIDGVLLSVNDRVLVKDQTSTFQNGVYEVTDTGSGATDWVLTRTTDYDQAPAEIKPGNIVPINEGTVNAGTLWIQTETVTTIGVDPIIFVPFGPSGSIYLTKAANLSDVTNTAISRNNLGLSELATQSTTNHAVIVGAPGDAITSLATGNSGQVLTSAGAAADPAFQNIGTNSGLTNHGVLVGQGAGAFVATTAGTTGQVLVAATGADPSWGTVSLTAGVTGILPVANGGTAKASFTPYTLITAGTTSTGPFQNVVSVGSSGQVLTSTGAASLPVFSGVGTNSGLTNHGVILGRGAGAFGATSAGTAGLFLKSNGAGADPDWDSVSLTTGVTGTLPIANGGTAKTSFTAYSVVCGGTTSTAPLQNVSGVGTSGQVLTSNGAAALPTWQAGGGGGGGSTTITVRSTPGSTTFFKNVATKMIEVYAWGGGGGGAAGNSQGGGGGGGNGGAFYYRVPATFVPASVNVVVGAGGSGGVGFDNPGTPGITSSFSNMSTGPNSSLENGGTGIAGGTLGTVFVMGTPPLASPPLISGSGNAYPVAGTGSGNVTIIRCRDVFQGSLLGTGGGGGASGVLNGGVGGSVRQATLTYGVVPASAATLLAGGTAGIPPNGSGGAGNDSITLSVGPVANSTLGFMCGGTGGGGGTGSGAGGAGGYPGAGGGGGGNTGNGGAGANGLVIIIEYS